jgi:thioredoxin reductase
MTIGTRPGAKARPRDLSRARPMLVAAAAAFSAIVAAVLLAPSAAGTSSPGPLIRPHVEAKLACTACHTASASAASACTGCHTGHASTRAAHRNLAARGELGCTSCHDAHGGGQGITFENDGEAIRWGGGGTTTSHTAARVAPGTTVPLVPLAKCARCHDGSRANDPVAACVARVASSVPLGERAVTCFDEHDAIVATSFHAGSARFVAWDAARDIAATTRWIRPEDESSRPWLWLSSAFGAAALAYAGASVRRRRPIDVAPAPAPPTLRRLPVVNPSTCLGCNACVDACPFDVLAVERYVAVVARPTECCSVGTCADVCPNESLRLDDGTPQTDGAHLDSHLESPDVPGIFLAGDLTGLPLIKNAIAQGVQVANRIGERRGKARHGDLLDVVVLGAGPAGLSAALRLKELDRSCIVVEQATLAASIRAFPRDKLVYDPPLDVPVAGALWLREATKEELLAQWTRIVRTHAVDVRERHRATAVRREPDGTFLVALDASGKATELRSRFVVVAIGRRGSPRKLACAIDSDAESHVSYSLADAATFAQKRIVIVGLGDVAMEAACAVARQPGARVTVSYRGRDFARGKARNIAELKRLADAGAIRIVFESTIAHVTASGVDLATPTGSERIPCDAVVVLIGGVPSWDLVRGSGVVVG